MKAQQKTGSAPPATAPGADRLLLPFGQRPARTFGLAIALPALLLYALTAILVIGALAVMANEMDRIERQRSVTAMHAALESLLNDMSSAASDEGTWDEAYLNVVVQPDAAWMDATWGATARLGQSYDTIFVTDQAGSIVYGQDQTGKVEGSLVTRYPVAPAMLRELDTGITATGDATTVSGFAHDAAGTVAVAAISVHKAATGQLNVPRGTRRILWLARHVTPGVLQDIAIRYQTPLATLTDTPEFGTSTIPLRNIDGNPVGTVAWTPDHPGEAAFGHAILVTAGILFLIGVGLVLGLGMLRTMVVRRADMVAAAQARAVETAATAAVTAEVAASVATEAPPAEDLPTGILDGVNAADFVIEYQPILDMRSEELIGVEGLLRWNRPDGTFLAQEQLAPRERARLLDRAGVIALRRATSEIAPLLGVTLTLTVTPGQLLSGVYSEKVFGTLGATGLPAARLQLAVDAPLLPPVAELAASMTELRQFGVSLTLAEFAIEPQTAAYVDAGLVDGVRLARSITGESGGTAHDALLVASIETARGAGLAITVPGIDRKEQAGRLFRLGCRQMQGGLLARPLPLAALTQLVLAPARKAS